MLFNLLITKLDVTAQDTEIIFFDDFEGNQVNDYPKGWSLKDYGTDTVPSKKYVYVTDKRYYSYNKSLKISGYRYSSYSVFAVAAFKYFSFQSRFLSFQLQFYTSEVSWYVEAGFRIEEFNRVAYFYMSDAVNSRQITAVGSDINSKANVTPPEGIEGKWTKIRFTLDTELEKLSVYINDILYAKDLVAKNAKSINSFWIVACDLHDAYFDDIIVFTGQEPPSIMPNAKIEAEITSVDILQTKFKAGDSISIKLTIKNTGNVQWTFYINGTSFDSKSVYSFNFPYKQITLNPGDTGEVLLSYNVGMSTPAGKYNLKVACWKEKTGEYLQRTFRRV